MLKQGEAWRNGGIDRQAGVFLSLSVCRYIYDVEPWKKEGPPPARNFRESRRTRAKWPVSTGKERTMKWK